MTRALALYQFSDGFSTCSITRTSTGRAMDPDVTELFSSAVKIDGALGSARCVRPSRGSAGRQLGTVF